MFRKSFLASFATVAVHIFHIEGANLRIFFFCLLLISIYVGVDFLNDIIVLYILSAKKGREKKRRIELILGDMIWWMVDIKYPFHFFWPFFSVNSIVTTVCGKQTLDDYNYRMKGVRILTRYFVCGVGCNVPYNNLQSFVVYIAI